MTELHHEVLLFIDRFTRKGELGQVLDVFLNGCCFWFAYILSERFFNSNIVYDPTVNHFATEIGGRVFDISGDVTDSGHWVPWQLESDQYEYRRVFQNCVLLE